MLQHEVVSNDKRGNNTKNGFKQNLETTRKVRSLMGVFLFQSDRKESPMSRENVRTKFRYHHTSHTGG